MSVSPIRKRILAGQLFLHPLQYAYIVDGQRMRRDTIVYNSEKNLPPKGERWERYNRCPNCEEWSPCTKRKEILSELETLK